MDEELLEKEKQDEEKAKKSLEPKIKQSAIIQRLKRVMQREDAHSSALQKEKDERNRMQPPIPQMMQEPVLPPPIPGADDEGPPPIPGAEEADSGGPPPIP